MAYRRKKIFFLFGPPGCGKGTQARHLAESLGIRHKEMSAILREGSYGEEVSQVIQSAQLVDDGIVIQALQNYLEEAVGDQIIDGYPRSPMQARVIVDVFSDHHDVYVIRYHLSDSETLSRLMTRASNGSTRGDDRAETHEKLLEKLAMRIRLYRESEMHIVGYLSGQLPDERFHTQCADFSPEEVLRQTLSALPVEV